VEVLSDDEICLTVRLTPEVEKSITMRVAISGLGFELDNQIRNLSDQTFRTASWGITTFAPGGVGYMPISKASSPSQALRANFQMNLWDYTNLGDSAFVFRSEWIECHQMRANSKQKIGTYAQNPWLAYRLGDSLVVKTFNFGKKEITACDFPDQGSNVELYFDAYMLELEGLSPWNDLKPGESVLHTEKLRGHGNRV